jgi:hypothetical protein
MNGIRIQIAANVHMACPSASRMGGAIEVIISRSAGLFYD